MEVLYGLHPVEEAIRSGARALDHVSVARDRRDEKLDRLIELCRSAGIRVTHESRDTLTKLARTDMHQGVLAMVRERKFLAIEDLMAPEKDGHRFFLALDGVEDPHNLGALLRTAEGAGVDGVILPERRSAPITATVAKTSAGASEHVKVARVTNLVRSLEQLKQKNVWVLGLDERGTPDYTDFDFKTDCVLVLGREGAGLHDLVKKTCDHLLRIPMAGKVSSLNVSVAGAIVMYEAMRQRRESAAPPPAPMPPKKRKGLGS
ncbi:23S rRNA (guanosine(2251)-2'-O)-methyltransferase RlmB [Granulicella arctica]|uniref:23S rRNA (Guanosine2251-2'-O)-methyltransferase n=1 Tax=Granulicella arctica TaxID=940613 RepID=A0A7Y9PDP5_9BACT|nr:23S rRNA (guanosine(2251)-2'-O)-methyltransferase RlmB [Granulicella arctica]NYF78016.1 23S rRNA (guanosine2251-2'-O)-methyltransferase [Granulicella arctica]